MTFIKKPPRYRSYLITMWEERSRDSDVTGTWRFRLEDPRTGQQRGFASLEALVEALKQEMGESNEQMTNEEWTNEQ